jgi:zinc transport system ATP-binding protein
MHVPTQLVSAIDLCVGYSGRPVLPAASFTLQAGAMCALIGRNGSGKSTMLRTLLGLLPAVSGRVERSDGLRVAYVAQRCALGENVPARVIDLVRGGWDGRWSFLRPHRGRAQAVARAMEQARCVDLAAHRFSDLSEGQKQRALLARALASEPTLLVLDEPTSAMDSEAESDLFEVLEQLRRERGLGIVVVSHHLDALLPRASTVLFVDSQAQVVRTATPRALAADPVFSARYPSWGGGEAAVSRPASNSAQRDAT